jgi:hypothetical protein
VKPPRSILRAILTSETAQAVLLAVLVFLLVVLTSDAAPRWIYQGF